MATGTLTSTLFPRRGLERTPKVRRDPLARADQPEVRAPPDVDREPHAASTIVNARRSKLPLNKPTVRGLTVLESVRKRFLCDSERAQAASGRGVGTFS
jgi:hypothetical protein